MIKNTCLLALLLLASHLHAQLEPDAGNWSTWFISSGKAHRLQAPPNWKNERNDVLQQQAALDSAAWQQILYWNAGAPGYRWQQLMGTLWMTDASRYGPLAQMLLGVATYDATVAAWDTKYAWKRPRPCAADPRIKALVPVSDSPSYPCEHSVAAGVGVAIIAHFFPEMADSVQRMAQELMQSRVRAGLAFPSDTKAGFELGKKIAALEIEKTKGYIPDMEWDGNIPKGKNLWRGKYAMAPLAGHNKTVVLDSSSQFRPGPPPDFAKDMAELKNFKPNFMSTGNAFAYAYGSIWQDMLDHKIFEYNLHLNPPRAARMYALVNIGMYDGFAACWDAKYTYWGIRPNQYDTTFHPVLLITPPFPGYPSGHAAIGAVMGDLYSYFFPAETPYFQEKIEESAESRFQAGIHFRTDNVVGVELGHKIAAAIIQKAKQDGADRFSKLSPPTGTKK